MRRVLPFALAVLPAIVAVALASPSDAARNGTVTFSGRIRDGNTPLAPGDVVTVRGNVIARSESCIEARVASTQSPVPSELWLCMPARRITDDMPDVGEPVAARARITGMRATAEGDIPFSNSFVLMRMD